jgi:GTP:adenosylcobinamide-phosphate guanylyltransferase
MAGFSIAAVVPAGFSPKEDDLLAGYTQGKSKALISIAGKPMVAHVVDALAGSRYVRTVVVVALPPAAGVTFSMPVEHVPDAGSQLGNVEAGFEHVMQHHPKVDGVLLCGADVPTITPAIVDAFVAACLETEHDAYYAIIERAVMEARFPGSRRSYVHLSDGEYAGGDMALFRNASISGSRELWQRLAGARKSALRQASNFGVWPLLKLVFRLLSLAEAERCACRTLELRGRAVPFPYAEAGMDVDKPHQLEIVRTEIESRRSSFP